MSRRGMVGLRAALFAGCASVLIAGAAHAQSSAPVALDIPASDLETALNKLAVQSGQEIAFQSATVAGRRSPAVKGTLTASQALAHLLQSSGLTARTSARGTVIVEAARPQGVADGSDTSPASQAEATAVESIVVTGTRIAGSPPVGSNVIAITRADIERQGFGSTQDLIRSTPQFSGIGATDLETQGTRNNGMQSNQRNTGYGVTANLRGLGSDATLVLVNGRRMASSGSGTFYDISQVPISAVERVEILTDGASAIYGSDAIAGVVNFQLRTDFSGAETRARYEFIRRWCISAVASCRGENLAWVIFRQLSV